MRVLLCGLGRMGQYHVKVLGTLGEWCEELVVCDSQTPALEALSERYKTYASLPMALNEQSFDAAILATSTDTHFELAQKIIRHGVPLLIEKPIAATSLEAAQLAFLADSGRVPLMVGHVERFNPAVVALHQLVRSGMLGAVFDLNFRRAGGPPRDRRRAGDVLIDLGIHDLDLASWLTGRELNIVGAAGSKSEVLEAAAIICQQDHTAVSINCNWWTHPRRRTITIAAERAYVEVDLIARTLLLHATDAWTANSEELGAALSGCKIHSQSLSVLQITPPEDEPLRLELQAFFTAVKSGSAVPVGAHEGLKALEYAERAKALIKLGGTEIKRFF